MSGNLDYLFEALKIMHAHLGNEITLATAIEWLRTHSAADIQVTISCHNHTPEVTFTNQGQDMNGKRLFTVIDEADQEEEVLLQLKAGESLTRHFPRFYGRIRVEDAITNIFVAVVQS